MQTWFVDMVIKEESLLNQGKDGVRYDNIARTGSVDDKWDVG